MYQGCLRKLILGSRSWLDTLWLSIRLNLICSKTLSVIGFVMLMLGCFVLLKAYVVRNTYLGFSILSWPYSLLMMTAFSLEDWVWCFHWGMVFWWRCGYFFWSSLLFDEWSNWMTLTTCKRQQTTSFILIISWAHAFSVIHLRQKCQIDHACNKKIMLADKEDGWMPLVWAYLAKEDHFG